MRNILLIATLLSGLFFLSTESKEKYAGAFKRIVSQEAVVKDSATADRQYHLAVLHADFKDCKGLTTRRTIQTVQISDQITRLLKIEKKIYQSFRLKEANLLRKTSEEVISVQTVDYSSLLCRMRYWIYGLRKIII